MVPERAKLHLAMTIFQFGYAGNHVIMRTALNMGVSKLVFPLYRNIIAVIVLVPFAYFLEKIEQIHLTRKDGIAKVLGTLISVGGASVITLYKGPIVYRPNSALDQSQSQMLLLGDTKEKNWTLGCICLIGHCLFWSSWIVLQSPVLKKYPARLSVVSYSCFFSLMQFSAIGAYFERDSAAWQFHSGWEIFCVFYSIWVIDRGGPMFVSAYLPVQTMLVAIMATIALGEEFYLGGVIGASLIIAGLYLVVLGKDEESKYNTEKAMITVSENTWAAKSSVVQPLLPTINES
ncbi:protein WALLS ARE THIN 1 [Citrus sinensis]|nr:protein WALLS ARE THIN 1 [Citrus sinensis]